MVCTGAPDDADADDEDTDDKDDEEEACEAADDANSDAVDDRGVSEPKDECGEVSDEVAAADAMCSDSGDIMSTCSDTTSAILDTRVMARCKATATSSSERASAASIASVVVVVDFLTADAKPEPNLASAAD